MAMGVVACQQKPSPLHGGMMRSRRVGVAYGVVLDSPAVGHTSSINIIQTTINDFAQRLPRLRDIFRRTGGHDAGREEGATILAREGDMQQYLWKNIMM